MEMLARGRRSTVVDGTVLFADVSGFTALSERLERRGREGAELMSDLLAAIFGPMLDLAAERGGDLLGYGGDALLLLFTGDDHERQALAAGGELLSVLGRRTPAHRAAGRVSLQMSMGAESGPVTLFAAGSDVTQLIVAGPVLEGALRAESAAEGGQLLVGPRLATASHSVPRSTDGLALVTEWPWIDPCGPLGALPRREELARRTMSAPMAAHLGTTGRFGEHRPVTAMFVKHPISADPTTATSRRRVATELDRITDTIVGLCDRHDVTLVAPDAFPGGVKFSIVAGAPVARGDSVDACVGLASDLVTELGDRVSIGINQGTVFCGEIEGAERAVYAVLGDAMNLAARVMARAAPGEVLIEANTASGGRVHRQLDPIEPFAAKGKRELVHGFRVGAGPTSPKAADAPAGVLGREIELDAIEAAWNEAKAGRSNSIAILAPPGLGKSTILRAWLEGGEHPRPLELVGGRLGRLTPFRALTVGLRRHFGLDDATDREVLVALDGLIARRAPGAARWRNLVALAFGLAVPDDSDVGDEHHRAERLHDALAAILAPRGDEPLVVVVDDAQWLDDASQAAVAHLADRAPGVVLVISAARIGEPSLLVDRSLRRVELSPLDDASARRIVRSASPLPLPVERIERIVQRAAGNPLFLAALATTDTGRDLPQTIEEAVRAELDRLPPTTRRILGDLAALGSTTDLGLAAAVLGVDRSASLGSLGADEFIHLSDGVVNFVHPLRREVAYEAMPFRDRRGAHRRALEHLLEMDDPSPSLLALHARWSSAHAETWIWARRAAAEPSARLAPSTAAEHLEWAVESGRRLRTVSAVDRADVLDDLGDLYETLGRFTDAERVFRAALAIDPEPRRSVQRLCRVARQCEHQGHLERGLRWARRAEVAAVALGPGTRALPRRAETSLLFRGGDLLRALAANEAAMQLATIARDRAMLGQTYRMAGTIKELTGRSGVSDLRRAVDLATAVGDSQSAAWALNNLGAALYDRGRWDEAALRYRRCAEVSSQIGDELEAATASNNLAEILSDQGHLDAAIALFADALDVFDGASYRIGRAVAVGNLARAHRRAGLLDLAADELAAATIEFESIGADDFVAEMRLRWVELRLAAGDIDLAADELASLRERGPNAGEAGPLHVAIHRVTGIVAFRRGDLETTELEIGAAQRNAREAQLRYEGALAREVAVACGIERGARSAQRLAGQFRSLGIVDSGQAPLLGLPSSRPDQPVRPRLSSPG